MRGSAGGIHLIESEFIAEVFDPQSGEEVPAAKLRTGDHDLGRAGFPVIRYRTGDLVRLNLAPCACGSNFRALRRRTAGRSDDMVTIRGVNVSPTAIET